MPTYAQFQAICVQLAYVSSTVFDLAAPYALERVSAAAFTAMPSSLRPAYAFMLGHILESWGYAAVGAAGAVPGPGQVQSEGTAKTNITFAVKQTIAGDIKSTFYGKAFANLARQAAMSSRGPAGGLFCPLGTIVGAEHLG
jgi:hypothetical protein